MSGGRPTLRLDWSEEALEQLAELVEWMPAACWEALEEMERMARTGFHYGRQLMSRPELWYFPVGKIGVYYKATSTAVRVIGVVDARRLADGP